MTVENISAKQLEQAIVAGLQMFSNEDVRIPITQMDGLRDLRNLLVAISKGEVTLSNPEKIPTLDPDSELDSSTGD